MSNKIGSFKPENINSLLKAPGKNVNTAKKNLIRQLNRTRKNTVMYQSDINKAFDTLENMLKTKKFDLSPYQEKIAFGTPEESKIAKHELRTLAIILRDILDGKGLKYTNQPFFKPSRYMYLKAFILQTQLISSIVITLTLTIIGGLTAGGVAAVLGASFGLMGIAIAREQTKMEERKVSERDLLLLILKVLDEEKKRPLSEQVFEMTNRNTGFVSTVKGANEMEINLMPTTSTLNNQRAGKSRKTRRQRR